MTTRDDGAHEAVRGALAEYALGVLDGRDRAAVMGHVEGCEECADEVRSLTTTADALVHVPVAADPPLGFESRVMERIRRSGGPHARTRTTLVSLAAAASVIGAFGVGWALQSATAPTTQAHLAGPVVERSLVAAGHPVGVVYVDTGRPSWMFVSLDVTGAPSRIRCDVITTSGRHDLVGTFNLVAGHGAWGTTLAVPWSSVRTVEITSMSGARVATLGAPSWPSPTPTVTN
ncbi:MAG: zf-HC2 domain-containing protein [Acidimicrobiales bacterium]